MDITVVRGRSTDDGTPGKLSTPDGFSCDSLELPWLNNRSGVSCIVPDTYSAEVWFSPHLGRNVLRLEDKHGRSDCLIHNGNFAGDVAGGDVTQVHGCTEVGRGYGDIEAPNCKKQFAILNSVATLDELIAHVGTGSHTVTYQWGDGCAPDDQSDQNEG